MPTNHPYPVHVSWQGGREGRGTAKAEHSGTDFSIAVPAEFQGSGGGTNPEEMLTSAIASCYSMTFGIIAANRKLPVAGLEVDAVGEVEQNGATFTYKSVVVRPRIMLEAGATDDQEKLAHDMAHKADLYCIITNAVRNSVSITIEPTITRG